MSCTDFPSTGLIPNVTTHTVGNITYIWTGIAWESQVNVPAGELVNDLSQAYIFDTVADYQASTIVFPVGKTIHLNDRGADFTVISGTGTANGMDIITNNSVSQSISLVTGFVLDLSQWGVSDTTVDNGVIVQAAYDFASPRTIIKTPTEGELDFTTPLVFENKPMTFMSEGPLTATWVCKFAGDLVTIKNMTRTIGGSTPQEWITAQQNGFSFQKITLEGNFRGQNSDAIVLLGENDDFNLSGVSIYNFKGAGIRWGDRLDTTSRLNMRESQFTDIEIKNCGLDTGLVGTSKSSVDMYKDAGNGADNFNNLTFTRVAVVYPRYIGLRFRNNFTANQFRKFTFNDCFFHGNKSLSGNDSNGEAWSNTENMMNISADVAAEVREFEFNNCKLIEHQDNSVGCFVGQSSSISWRGGEAQGYAADATSRLAFQFQTANQSFIGDMNSNAGNAFKGMIDVISMNSGHTVSIGELSRFDDGTGVATVTAVTDQDLIHDLTSYKESVFHVVDASAVATVNVTPFVLATDRSYVKNVWFIPDDALTASDTDFASLIYRIFNTSGSALETIATTTKTGGSGGTGNWAARVPVQMNLPTTQKLLQRKYSIAFNISKGGAGVVIPDGSFVIEISKSVRYRD